MCLVSWNEKNPQKLSCISRLRTFSTRRREWLCSACRQKESFSRWRPAVPTCDERLSWNKAADGEERAMGPKCYVKTSAFRCAPEYQAPSHGKHSHIFATMYFLFLLLRLFFSLWHFWVIQIQRVSLDNASRLDRTTQQGLKYFTCCGSYELQMQEMTRTKSQYALSLIYNCRNILSLRCRDIGADHLHFLFLSQKNTQIHNLRKPQARSARPGDHLELSANAKPLAAVQGTQVDSMMKIGGGTAPTRHGRFLTIENHEDSPEFSASPAVIFAAHCAVFAVYGCLSAECATRLWLIIWQFCPGLSRVADRWSSGPKTRLSWSYDNWAPARPLCLVLQQLAKFSFLLKDDKSPLEQCFSSLQEIALILPVNTRNTKTAWVFFFWIHAKREMVVASKFRYVLSCVRARQNNVHGPASSAHDTNRTEHGTKPPLLRVFKRCWNLSGFRQKKTCFWNSSQKHAFEILPFFFSYSGRFHLVLSIEHYLFRRRVQYQLQTKLRHNQENFEIPPPDKTDAKKNQENDTDEVKLTLRRLSKVCTRVHGRWENISFPLLIYRKAKWQCNGFVNIR